jgi:quinohemoprotein ethanol dehydrogenase
MKFTMIRLALSATLVAGALSTVTPAEAAPVTSDDLIKAQDNAAEWLMYGRDYRNWRYSPLDKITTENAAQLKPVWTMSTGGKFGGLEATPLYRDGMLYFTTDYARVFAVDAKSGVIRWRYEPQYEDGLDAVLCCGPSSRGLALKDTISCSSRGWTRSWWR